MRTIRHGHDAAVRGEWGVPRVYTIPICPKCRESAVGMKILKQSCLALCTCAIVLSVAYSQAAERKPAAQRTTNSRIDVPDHPRPALLNGVEVRTIDGSNNNPDHPEWGMADQPLRRTVPPAYADGVSAPSGTGRPNPRALSNAVLAQSGTTAESDGMTDMFWLWGQFIDHDLSLTEVADPVEHWPISIPAGDPWFDPGDTGTQEMALERSAWMPGTGTGPDNPRRQVNNVTTWLDGSMIYGSDPVRADALRTPDGTGRLKTSAGDLLPFNLPGLPNGGGTSADLFLAGDVRANENLMLTTMHTIWVREHNRLAGWIAAQNPGLTGDRIYEEARARVGAMLQVITYNEFLPILLGPDALPPYDGYDDDQDPRIANVFSTAAFRLGHSMVSPELKRMNADLQSAPGGALSLREAFFRPDKLQQPGMLTELLRGAAMTTMQHLDARIIDDLRNFLFGPPGSGGFDLTALNIQRARDHGLPDYNTIRVAYGMPPVSDFSEITDDPRLRAVLGNMYGDVDSIDPWIGALSEDRRVGAMLGPTFQAVLTDQFRRLRDADRFWYQRMFSGDLLDQLENTRLVDVIRRNTEIGDEIPDSVLRGEPQTVVIPAINWSGLLVLMFSLVLIGWLQLRRPATG